MTEKLIKNEQEAIEALKLIKLSRVHPFYSWEEMLEVRDMAMHALEEIHQYRAIGSVEECRAAVEKQKAKKYVIDSCPDHAHYKCPSCGNIHMTIYKPKGPQWGHASKFCEICGQAIDRAEEGG